MYDYPSLWLTDFISDSNAGSNGWVKGAGGKKHEIYAAAFGGELFYDLFL